MDLAGRAVALVGDPAKGLQSITDINIFRYLTCRNPSSLPPQYLQDHSLVLIAFEFLQKLRADPALSALIPESLQ